VGHLVTLVAVPDLVEEPTTAVARRHESALLDPIWPVLALTIWMPVAYLIGLSAVMWILPAFAFGIPLLLRPSLRVPGMVLPLVALAAWIPLTALELPGMGGMPVFLYRWLLWVSAVAALLWLCNTSPARVSTERIVDLLAALWIVLVAFGYLAILMPTFAQPSLIQRFLPEGLLSNSFIYDLTVVRFAELQIFDAGAGATSSVPRPAAPMPYTNGWGSTLGLLTPFFICSWIMAKSQIRRIKGWIIALLAVVPIAVSTNRGMWLSIAIALMYWAFRRMLQADVRPMIVVGVIGALAIGLVLFTPLDSFVTARLNNSEASNSTRETVYKEAYEGALAAPILGHGAPVPTENGGPPVGTHGLVWFVMFSFGFPGLLLLFAALSTLFVSTVIARTPTALWAHIVILICITQIAYYGLLPQIVLLGFAAGICWRENHPEEAALEPR
jgi:polysaccharide biosynthesis protein PslJ